MLHSLARVFPFIRTPGPGHVRRGQGPCSGAEDQVMVDVVVLLGTVLQEDTVAIMKITHHLGYLHPDVLD